ncbi:BMP/retinoic acid-inducible neural-specific protein 3-like isoform X1 [Pseudoliparis swirei]|uniref:BMP/retinoic acid-inducible neural-specific protein 3-like isoform X1 n=1 Tax=Pseudoliparis swirei TaxID=2059687 RepID=UPI0024BF0C06|nr:BMP/retinoic acid-inducible neural-specific protein 3-like isoform X1 [Pseudoliparis swirei]XP_056277496.1 BMP/retinoic acid-inducible neural-specific protein 3-like isoform X1 [Pseudoliparis swirei]
MSCQRISHRRLSLLWVRAAFGLWLCCCWTSGAGGAASAAGQDDGAPGSLDWLLSDKGPFHQALEFTEAAERYQQGFSTRYKIYREFGRWKVNSLAVEKRDGLGGSGGLALPLDPDFTHTIRLLGRRPTLQTITQSLIKKYGTHLLLSATLGGEESLTIFVDKRKLSQESSPVGADGSNRNSNTTGTLEALHQLAASYFTDRESTLRRLHHLQIASTAIRVTETRTGPLGCSNYDNLDTVSSVLVHSPENKVQLQGLQVILPGYLQSRFIEAALNYVGCKSEGQFVCHSSDCWCECSVDFPLCNCPLSDLETLEGNLLRIRDTRRMTNQEFEESEEFQSFVEKLPTHYAVNTSVVEHMWRTDASLLQRYRQLETSGNQLLAKARRTVNKLFSLSKRCRKQPKIVLQRTRPRHFWLSYALSILYCSENNQVGVYSDENRSCSCPYNRPACQGLIPCSVGDGARCVSCSTENKTRCSSCNLGFTLSQGACRPAVPDPTDPYLGLESDRDLQDLELRYLLQRRDPRIALHGVFVSNDVRVNTWFDPSWRKRMLLTLKSNRVKSTRVHMLLGLSLQFCLTRNSTLEPALSLFVNPFGGSHSESWTMPIGQHGYSDWERTKLDIPLDCYNWTLTLGNRWKSFFETVHFYLRSRIRDPVGVTGGNKNMTVYYEPLEATEPSNNIGYMKVNSIQLFGYSVHFDPEAIQDLILQIDYPYTQGSQDSALLQLVELRYRVNRLSPPGAPHMDLFACLLRHRLKLSSADVTRILTALQAFSARQANDEEYEANKLCS